VVGHQDVSIEPKAVALAIVLDALEVALAVVLVVEGLLALVAAHYDVVEGTVKLDSGLSRHAGTVSVEKTECQITQYSGLTLFLCSNRATMKSRTQFPFP
jgi:uncharacterized protein YjeT (DUF2065 family)